MKHKNTLLSAVFVLLGTGCLHAQERPTAAGGEAMNETTPTLAMERQTILGVTCEITSFLTAVEVCNDEHTIVKKQIIKN